MEWQFTLLFLVGSVILLMLLGMPVFISFMLVNIIGAFIFMRGVVGLEQFITSLDILSIYLYRDFRIFSFLKLRFLT